MQRWAKMGQVRVINMSYLLAFILFSFVGVGRLNIELCIPPFSRFRPSGKLIPEPRLEYLFGV